MKISYNEYEWLKEQEAKLQYLGGRPEQNRVMIETNENDYMEYFESASTALEVIFQKENKTIKLDELIDCFISLTKTANQLLKEDDENHNDYIDSLKSSFEVYVGNAIPENYSNNGSHIFIDLNKTKVVE